MYQARRGEKVCWRVREKGGQAHMHEEGLKGGDKMYSRRGCYMSICNQAMGNTLAMSSSCAAAVPCVLRALVIHSGCMLQV